MSGLAAASALQARGVQVTVLEARDTVGGRVRSDVSLGAPVEVGAGWIEGVKGNPISKLASRYRLKTLIDEEEYLYYDTAGARRPVARWERRFEKMQRRIDTFIEDLDEDTSYFEAAAAAIGGVPMAVTDAETFYSIISGVEGELAGDSRILSAFESDASEEFPGPQAIVIPGYQQIPRALSAGLSIQYNTSVTAIKYTSSGVVVTTSRGEFTADVAVVTLPLGVLRRGSVTFEPALPASKVAAINSLNMGLLNRVILRFPRVFWPARALHFECISTEESAARDFLNLHPVTKLPILTAFLSGTYAAELELRSDEDLVAIALAACRSMFGSKVPDPIASRITRWGADPFTYGSYSCVPVGASARAYDILAQPVESKLFFAGEATNKKYSATVHGAYLSGLREAQRILTVLG